MDIKNILCKIICFISIIILICSMAGQVFATSKSELNSEIDEINKLQQQKEEEKKQVSNEKSAMLTQVESLITQISNYESEIDNLESQIKTLEGEITTTQEKLSVEEENFKKQEQDMQSRLIAIYEMGETSVLDMILSSKGIVDLVSNYYLASELANYDAELLDEIERKKNEIQVMKESLENKKNQIEINKKNKEQTSKALYDAKQVKSARAAELSEEEKQIQADLEQFEKDKREIQAKLAKLAAQEAEKNGGNYNVKPSASGYIKPVNGYSITTGIYYSNGSYHGGVDYSGSGIGGKPILAVKSGTVVTSDALKYPNGRYRSYGEYIIINHHDGTMTLYAHGQPGSRKVVEGQKVSQGQVIMNVGTTGNSTGNHLHFEVRVNGRRVDPRPYLP